MSYKSEVSEAMSRIRIIPILFVCVVCFISIVIVNVIYHAKQSTPYEVSKEAIHNVVREIEGY